MSEKEKSRTTGGGGPNGRELGSCSEVMHPMRESNDRRYDVFHSFALTSCCPLRQCGDCSEAIGQGHRGHDTHMNQHMFIRSADADRILIKWSGNKKISCRIRGLG